MNRLALLVLIPVFWLIAFISIPRYVWAIATNPGRAQRLAVSYDQLANTIFNGDEDETISSRAAKAARKRQAWGCVLCRLLDLIDRNHCEKNIEYDRGKKS